MAKNLRNFVKVGIKAVLPTTGGCAVFIGDDKKVFIIYVDHAVGAAISSYLQGLEHERPLTHDLMSNILKLSGAEIKHVKITNVSEGIYIANIYLHIENELGEKKIIEIDARPSDTIALALRVEVPIYVAKDVFEQSDDMSEILKKLKIENDPLDMLD